MDQDPFMSPSLFGRVDPLPFQPLDLQFGPLLARRSLNSDFTHNDSLFMIDEPIEAVPFNEIPSFFRYDNEPLERLNTTWVSSMPSMPVEPRPRGRPKSSKPKQIKNCPSRKFKKITDECKECCICLESFSKNGMLRILPCNHQFHRKCIDKWYSKVEACPLCRCTLE